MSLRENVLDITKEYFLVTTSLKSSLPNKNDAILYLGEWCLPDNEYIGNVMPYIYNSGEKMNIAYSKCEKYFKKYLSQLTLTLNKIHNLNYDKKAYNIILGNWLKVYIHQLYEKYTMLKFAYCQYNIKNTYINGFKNYIPLDFNDYMKYIVNNDEYNFQQYSQLINILGYRCTQININYELKQKNTYSLPYNKKKNIIESFFNLMNLFFSPKVIITSPYFNGSLFRNYLKIFFSKVGFYGFTFFQKKMQIETKFDNELRENIKLDYCSDEFEKVLSLMLFKNIPWLFLEGFNWINQLSKSFDKSIARIYYTSNALHSNYLYKFFLARNYKKIIIISHQHGGGYGTHKINMMESYERSIVDKFYTWGWSEKKAKYLAHEKIAKNGFIQKFSEKTTILIPLTGLPRYLHRFQDQFFSSLYLEYQYSLITFINLCSKDLKENILVRNYSDYYEWDTDKKIEKLYSNIKYDNSRVFQNSMNNSKVIISLHLSSTYLESLSKNIPTLVYIDKNIYKFRKNAEKYIESLHENKIVFYDIDSLVYHLKSVYFNIEEWWFSSSVQKARREFCHQYSRASDDWIKDWLIEFQSILNSDERK